MDFRHRPETEKTTSIAENIDSDMNDSFIDKKKWDDRFYNQLS